MKAQEIKKGEFVRVEERKGVWKIVGVEFGLGGRLLLELKPESNQPVADETCLVSPAKCELT